MNRRRCRHVLSLLLFLLATGLSYADGPQVYLDGVALGMSRSEVLFAQNLRGFSSKNPDQREVYFELKLPPSKDLGLHIVFGPSVYFDGDDRVIRVRPGSCPTLDNAPPRSRTAVSPLSQGSPISDVGNLLGSPSRKKKLEDTEQWDYSALGLRVWILDGRLLSAALNADWNE